ncbi:helix-turn-helix transcriptional regulator [Saccharothrix longispora]|uniref:Transcriptional regulator with XRE-family HTH domain n=1 Tax=Saccharothrix longispora TaxID=33920 RepID=A0ABU1PLV2_9PSEU|nr:helix-turn-helix transcriptional regulator [Saccharothrix longispora]MDR6591638.1 transcriptional regulator with XRE-family HTH domain [Saccharothrix longispora]
MSKQQSSVATRRIGFELERLRRAAGHNLQNVAGALGVSISTLSRLENGKREPNVEEVASILTFLGVVGPERHRLLDEARGSGRTGHIEISPVRSRTYRDFEMRATTITNYELMLVPGLAQTPDYTRAALNSLVFDQEKADIEARVAQRAARQNILNRPVPPQLHLIISEAALRLRAGAHGVMAAQLRHLITLSSRPKVSIRVVPALVGLHAGLSGQFSMLDFPDASTIVHTEDSVTSLFVDDYRQVQLYRLTAEKLMTVALDERKSVHLMVSIANGLDGG